MQNAALRPTEFLDFNHPAVQEFIEGSVGDLSDPTEIALALYYAVRDLIRYDPYSIDMSVEGLRASTTLKNGSGWCVPKAVLLTACYRAKSIPAKLGYADVKNHLTSKRLRETMKTDVFAWHGYTSVLLNRKWVKATPAFNKELCEKANIFPLEFNGLEDSIYHEFDRSGQQHMEYMKLRGEYNDVPMEEIKQTFAEFYGVEEIDSANQNAGASSFTEDVASEAAKKS